MWSLAHSSSHSSSGRFAPTPTGALHVGNAYSALLSIISAKAHGYSTILRIDDLDVKSIPLGCLESQLADLQWLGLQFDEGLKEGGHRGPYRQSARSDLYESSIKYLNKKGLLYPCYCSRKEIAAVAPHASDEGLIYPGTCRPKEATPLNLNEVRKHQIKGRLPTLRFNTSALDLTLNDDAQASSSRLLRFDDLICGLQSALLDTEVGDFVVQRRDGVYAYQLACAVDDYSQGCAIIARGADLITSTHRQRLILSALDIPCEAMPQYAHAGLVVDSRGERLAKRNQSIQLSGLREAGVSPESVCAALSRSLGGPDTHQIDLMVSAFKWSQVSSGPICWTLD